MIDGYLYPSGLLLKLFGDVRACVTFLAFDYV